ncbi:hypothetical protein GCM10025770_12160 [Viridibacterium curvum]|uniref:Uncharacterized protein n=1 Tax=Viridibacterium curvum TaxID=1101404 RepID=A0ABP9QHH3_9RHOO
MFTVGEGIALSSMACETRRTTQRGVVLPRKECNAVSRAIKLNPEGSYAIAAWRCYGSLSGSLDKIDPDRVAAPCPATIAYERNPSPTVNTP